MIAPAIVAVTLLALGGTFLLVSVVRRVRREDRWSRFEAAFREYVEQSAARQRIPRHRRGPRET